MKIGISQKSEPSQRISKEWGEKMIDVNALYGYPSWEYSGFTHMLLPCDGLIAKFRPNLNSGLAYSALFERGLIKRFRFHANDAPLRDGFALYMTSRCNCQCEYCESEHISPVRDMGLETLNAAFEFCAWTARRLGGRKLSITLLGGEPTIMADAIAGLMERLRLANVDAIASLCTNGMLSEENLRRLLLYDNIEWRISLDVPGKEHSCLDYRRGIDYFQVYKAIKAVVKHKRPHQIRTTVTDRNLSLMEAIASECEALGARKITFTPMRYAYGRSLNMPNAVVDPEEYAKAWFSCRRKFNSVSDTHFDMLFGKTTAYCSSVFIMPDGTILPTISESYKDKRFHIGNVLERDWTALEEKLNSHRKQFLNQVEENCKDCVGRHICSGGSMAPQLHMGRRGQSGTCLHLRAMAALAAERINELLPDYGRAVESLPEGIELIDYRSLKSRV
ncbi:MAG: radical SAM protein [Clostridiales bacterium]|jgi:radical SAM protein with 4Fe4S-binding SPASM domain|nr:radical SAM protein [Clostridiales bacterium]